VVGFAVATALLAAALLLGAGPLGAAALVGVGGLVASRQSS
jgi:hypothetical protein